MTYSYFTAIDQLKIDNNILFFYQQPICYKAEWVLPPLHYRSMHIPKPSVLSVPITFIASFGLSEKKVRHNPKRYNKIQLFDWHLSIMGLYEFGAQAKCLIPWSPCHPSTFLSRWYILNIDCLCLSNTSIMNYRFLSNAHRNGLTVSIVNTGCIKLTVMHYIFHDPVSVAQLKSGFSFLITIFPKMYLENADIDITAKIHLHTNAIIYKYNNIIFSNNKKSESLLKVNSQKHLSKKRKT